MTKYPCSLCHFCVKVDLDTHGAQCVWYDMYLRQDLVDDPDMALRQACVHDRSGDRFLWRLPNIPPLDYARWRQGILQTPTTSIRATIALVLSGVALITSIVLHFMSHA